MTTATARGWYHPVAIYQSFMLRPRILFAVLMGAVAFFLSPSTLPGTLRTSIAWDVGGIAYLLLAFRIMYSCDASHIKSVASARDDSRVVILAIILMAIGASFVAIAQLIGHGKQASVDNNEKLLLALIAILTIVISWSVTQVAFTLHYAHEYYRPGEKSDAQGGLDFPHSDTPDYWDFLYFATSIGATSQTSDTAIKSHNLRRLVTLHAVIAFFFNTAVLALTVNIAASLA